MKNKMLVGTLLVIVGVALGFGSQYSRRVAAEQKVDSLQQDLAITQRAAAMNSFRNRAAMLYMETARSNFSVALDMASKYFTDLRTFTDQTRDATLKQELEKVLISRDTIIAGLAKADPTINGQIQEIFLGLQPVN
ncbi:MAG: hypothetical protein ABI833_19030 [Acidobacteriota bacterium]